MQCNDVIRDPTELKPKLILDEKILCSIASLKYPLSISFKKSGPGMSQGLSNNDQDMLGGSGGASGGGGG